MGDVPVERMLKWFDLDHVSATCRKRLLFYRRLAADMISYLEPGPERTVALRKLLESQDAAYRAMIHPGG